MADEVQAGGENAQEPQFAIQRIYTKDVSFETPNSPAIFQKNGNQKSSLTLIRVQTD